MSSSLIQLLTFLVIMIATILGLAGIDLVLPAVPELPVLLGGSQASAQFVLAAYVLGTAIGLVLFGELGARLHQGYLLTAALIGFAATSFAATFVTNIDTLIGLRLVQGIFGSAGAVFAPVWISQIFGERKAVRAIGLLNSIESLTPALAPVLGIWILGRMGWQGSFNLLAIFSLAMIGIVVILGKSLPGRPASGASTPGMSDSYLGLFRNPMFLRLALSHAACLSGLLVFVFGAPAVYTKAFGGSINDFIIQQIVGISCFIVASNSASRIVLRLGAEKSLMLGALVALSGGLGIFVYACLGGTNTLVYTLFFIPVNVGLGIRGPVGFHKAIVCAKGNESRGAAVILLVTFFSVAVGTALAAPFVDESMVILAAISFLLLLASALLLRVR